MPTVGIDYESRSLFIENQVVHLKFWDTAGQVNFLDLKRKKFSLKSKYIKIIIKERFRSIVKAYYRETDCFICMYDITSEKSFLSLRNWITSIHVCLVNYFV